MEDSQLFSISDQPDDSSVTPIYDVAHVIDIDSDGESDPKAKKPRLSRNCCWNCGGTGHSLRQCPLPYDQRQVNRNRSSFASRVEFKRYHVELKDGGFPHLKPGIISDKLREALGLSSDQLPMHVYRMRFLGYPPGWLLEAKVDSSGIEMFDIDGNRVPNADEEEGEIGSAVTTLYDESKIITYPGFNEWPEPGTRDESREYGVPDLDEVQSKEEFIKSLKNIKPPTVEPLNKHMRFDINDSSECDMETEDTEDINLLPEDNKCGFIPPLPDDSELPPPPPEELEEGEVMECLSGDTSRNWEDLSTPDKKKEDRTDPNSEFADSSHGRIKSIELGTPALKIHSPFQRLPPPEAFRKDISDVINFENLPDSTGAYEKLKGVLKNVRSKLSVLKDGKMNATI